MLTASSNVRKKGSWKMKLSYGGQCGRNGFMAYVDSGDRPVLSVFHEIRCHQTNIGTFIWKDSNHAGTSADFTIQSLNHVGRWDFSCVQHWECIEGQRIFQSVLKTLNRFRKALGIGVDHIEWRCGSNENANRLIRRWFPKGTDFSKVTAAQIAALQDWINNYPRKVLNWSISNTVYELYMQQE